MVSEQHYYRQFFGICPPLTKTRNVYWCFLFGFGSVISQKPGRPGITEWKPTMISFEMEDLIGVLKGLTPFFVAIGVALVAAIAISI